MDWSNLRSLLGMFVLLGLAWMLSTDRRRINWRVVGWGLAIQFLVAVFLFLSPLGTKFFTLVNDLVVELLGSASAGSHFLFGRLAIPAGATGPDGEPSLGFILAFQALPTIVFFSALMSILYYFNIMPWMIRGFAYVFTRLMRVSGAESLCAASNIFVGVESALTVRPHLEKMTRSELCTVLTAGMATVASNVLAFYVYCLGGTFPNIGGHLVCASILSAPAALVFSKMLLPETGKPATLAVSVRPHFERDASFFEAIINGANAGLKLIFGIVALLLAVLGLVELVDLVLGAVGGAVTGGRSEWSLRGLLGIVFYPCAILIGVPLDDAGIVSGIIGERLVATEVAGYRHLAAALADKALASPRSPVLTAYALCGFAHVASLSIFVGGTSALAPSRAGDLAKVGVRALIAATLACLVTACVAGVFLTDRCMLVGRMR